MKEQFDKELRNHIKDTFGAFDDHLADDGWRKLNDRKKKKRRAFIFWYILPSGIAASIAFLLFFNLNNENAVDKDKNINQEKIAINESSNKNSVNKEIGSTNSTDLKDRREDNTIEKYTNSKNQTIKNIAPIRNQESNETSQKIAKTSNVNSRDIKIAKETIAPNMEVKQSTNSFDKKIKTYDSEKITVSINPQNTSRLETSLSLENNQNLNSSQKSNDAQPSNYIRENIEEIYAQEKRFVAPKDQENLKLNPKLLTSKTNLSIEKLVLANQAKADNNDKKSNQLSKKFKIGIDANTYVNFSENGIEDKLNLGLGIVSEIKLNKNFSLNTGVALNSQNGNFNGNRRSNQDFLRTANSFSNIATVPTAQVTSAKLIGLDIPINLKYQLQIGKTTSFVASGFSSYSVINERYVNEFSVINYSFNGVTSGNVTSVNDNPKGKFSYFKFARTLDFSLGIIYPISKKSVLSIEPFMKYPIAGLGYQDLKIGSSGVSFKMNFGK